MYSENGLSIDIYGESHSEYIGVIIYGVESGQKIDLKKLSAYLKRRKAKEFGTARAEKDEFEILSGIVGGITNGEKIELRFKNADAKKEDYLALKDLPRPSTSDYPAMVKGIYTTGGGAFSGRMTVALCAVGGILTQILEREKIKIFSHILSIGKAKNKPFDKLNPVKKEESNKKILSELKRAKKKGDSLGGIIECAVTGLKVGVGGALYDGLEGLISENLFAIPSVKGVEFGSGFYGATLRGSENNDGIIVEKGKIKTATNNAGGILGGMANGMPIIFSTAFKPIPSISLPQKTVDVKTKEQKVISVCGRHDTCAVLRAGVIVESATAIAIYSALKKEQGLKPYRDGIDYLDDKIATLLEERLNVVRSIGRQKKKDGKKIKDPLREKQITDRLKANHPEAKEYIDKIYKDIFEISRGEEK